MGRLSGLLFLTGAFFLAGTSVVAARFVSGRLGTFTITAASLSFALLGLLPVCGYRLRKTIQQMKLQDWLAMLFQAVCGIFLFRIFLLKGLIRTSAGEAGILTGATPAVTAFLAWLVLKERLEKVRVLGLISTITGILIIQGVLILETGFTKEHFIGNLLVLCAATCESIFNVLSRISSMRNSLSESRKLDPVVQTTFVAGIALVICIGPAFSERPLHSLKSLDSIGWIALIWYGLFVTALAFILWYAGIKRCEASSAAAFSGMMPFTSIVLSVLILGEQPQWYQWIGALMIITGMVLTGQEQHKQVKSVTSEENYPLG